MAYLQIADQIKELGLSLVISAVFIYICVEYFRMKKQEHEIKYQQHLQRLPNKVVEQLVESVVWSYSKSKLQMVRSVLIINNLTKREEEIKLKVKNNIIRIAEIYIDYFNSLNTVIPNLGDWYDENFDTDEFLEEIYAVMFVKTRTPINGMSESYKEEKRINFINEQMEDISNIMIKYEHRVNQKLRKHLHEELHKISQNKTKPFLFM